MIGDFLFLLCFIIKFFYLLNMPFSHNISSCFSVFNNVNYFVKNKSQLDRLLAIFHILTGWLLLEVTVEGVIMLLTVQEFCL